MSESRIDAVIAEYLAACDAGSPPDRTAFLAKHADLARELTALLDDHERMRAAADPEATIAPPSAAPAMLRYVGDYELLDEIARGGMGVVYRARQVTANRLVAVKMVLAGNFADAAGIQRFRIEAEAAANLDHPNILPIYEVSEHEGRPYFSMKLAEGGSLAGCKLSQRESASLVAKLARAVHHAHQRGILHRDLKPANVLLDATGEPLIADFGLAKRVEQDTGATQTGAIVGTPSYMPPEQARGERVTTAADVYSLGAIFYECLTGRPPFRKASVMETLLAVMEQEPAPLANTDGDLAIITLKCLRKESRERYASAADLADELDRWCRGEPIQARPVGRFERVAKWVRRNPVVASLVTIVFVVLATGVVASWVLTAWALAEKGNAEQQARLAQSKKAEADSERRRAEVNLTLAEGLVYAGKLSLAQSAFAEGDGALAICHLDDCQWNLRGWEHRHLWTRYNPKQTFSGHTADVHGMAFSPNGKYILTGSWDRTAKVWDAQTGRELLTLNGHTNGVTSVAFSPDGKRIATGSYDKTAKLWDARTGRELISVEGGSNGHRISVAFSPDGKRFVSGSTAGPLKVWDAATGQEVLSLKGHTNGVGSLAFSPDGRRIVTGRSEVDATGEPLRGEATVWDATTGLELLTLKELTSGVTSVGFSPDGKRILTGSRYSLTPLKPGEAKV